MKEQVKNPIFMIGMPRSGSTILSEAISLHDSLGWFSNLLNMFPRYPLISILNRIVGLPAFNSYLRGKKKQDNNFISNIRRFMPRPEEPYPALKQYCGKKIFKDYLIGVTASEVEKNAVRKFVAAVLKAHGKNRLFVKFTGPPRIYYLNSIFPDAYYIHIIRDPKAVVSSLLNVDFFIKGGGLYRPFWHNGLTDEYIKEWDASDRSPVALAAIQWRRVVELTWQERKNIPDERFIEVKYEDFVEDPKALLEQIFLKLGLPDFSPAYDYIEGIGKIKNMNYKFKEILTENDIEMIELLTKDIAVKIGYGL